MHLRKESSALVPAAGPSRAWTGVVAASGLRCVVSVAPRSIEKAIAQRISWFLNSQGKPQTVFAGNRVHCWRPRPRHSIWVPVSGGSAADLQQLWAPWQPACLGKLQ
mmetsp:Transcript_26375/g.74231  ORF Transcript_26375/g.74231 Transcript_26375/m.74231 type:complete len:107 (+) Transcript_26375:1796-2116(+)